MCISIPGNVVCTDSVAMSFMTTIKLPNDFERVDDEVRLRTGRYVQVRFKIPKATCLTDVYDTVREEYLMSTHCLRKAIAKHHMNKAKTKYKLIKNE